VGKRGLGGVLLILAGAILLSAWAMGHRGPMLPLGPILVVAACAFWGLDNNLTQRISLRDARRIGAIKGLVGGAVSLSLALLFRQTGALPGARSILAIAVLGSVSYGLSIVLFIRGLRELGIVQTGALFASAPGFAALLSWVFLLEPCTRPRSCPGGHDGG